MRLNLDTPKNCTSDTPKNCTSENEVWALGESTDPGAIDRFVYFFDGFSWDFYWLSSESDANDIWCADKDRVCIVGDYGTVWNGTACERLDAALPLPPIRKV